MELKIKDRVVDSKKEPILFVFKSSEERIQLINNLIKMDNDCTKFLMYQMGSLTEEESNKILKDEN